MSVPLPAPNIKIVGPNILEVVVTYLEMKSPPATPKPPSPKIEHRIDLVERPSVPFYRYLYNTVGAPWLWHERRRMDDATLAGILKRDDLWVYVIYADGEPAGYAELDASEPADIQLAYFGIVPKFIGRRLGPTLLRAAVDIAWSRRPKRVWVHTCSLDHPKALNTYKRCGFQIYNDVTRRIRDPRPLPLNL